MTEAAWRCVKALDPCFSVAYSLLSRVWACPLSCFPPIMAFSCYSGSAMFCPLPCALFAPYPSVLQRFELRQFCSVVRFRYDGISHLGALPPLFAVPPPVCRAIGIDCAPQNTYTFLLYTPSALDFGQNCGVVAYLLYPGAGKAASAQLLVNAARAALPAD
jgi:hypothetical protein